MTVAFSQASFLRAITRPDQAPTPARPGVVFAGRSNVGKSSLINSLLRRKGLAKTSSTPGRTREIVYFNVDDRFYFIDIPGYGYAKTSKAVKSKWGPMIEEFLTGTPSIRLVVLILDARRDPSTEDLQMVEWLRSVRIPCQIVVSKIDKVRKTHRDRHLRSIAGALGLDSPTDLLTYSSEDGTGRPELIRVLLEALEA